MNLTQLVKLNRIAVEEIKSAKDWEENKIISSRHLQIGNEYRNRLLKNFEGQEVTFKGYIVDEYTKCNFTVTCIEIYYKGSLIDTVHHLNLFFDALSNYSLQELRTSIQKCVGDALFVEGRGTVFSYRGKYSIGTARQIAYVRNKLNN